ncbi:MAG: twin-arginine translocase subunit TatC [Candidatus Omnitrophica bacterium]|nr:twin-arginine translocase subunit TatC [Candidatus Omnitrophota bacterium]
MMNQPPKRNDWDFIRHLEELRRRIFSSFLIWLSASILAYWVVSRYFLKILLYPLKGKVEQLVYLTPVEPFFTLIKLALAAGLLLSLPLLLYQAWSFLRPGLHPPERKPVLGFITSFFFLFYGGCAFGYFVVLPPGLKFLLSVAPPGLQPFLSFNSYLTFLLIFILGFGLVFTLPDVILLLGRLGIVRSQFLRRQRRIFIILAFVIAAVITPSPDAFTQTLMALPLVLLYEISIVLVTLSEKRRDKRTASEETP